MLGTGIATKIVIGVIGLTLVSSGLAYAGAPTPNPVGAAVDAVRGPQTADDKQKARERYFDAVDDWTACVDEAAATFENTPAGRSAPDPLDACGEPPRPEDHGLTDVPEQTDDPTR